MDQKLMDCFANPVQCRLLLEILSCGETTAKHLADTYPDISQATLYRHLKRMSQEGILKIVQENQVRGAIEKTYSAAVDFSKEKELLDQNSGPTYLRFFMQYMMGFTRQFQAYCARPNLNLQQDRSGFSMAPIYATDEELDEAIRALSGILAPLAENKAGEGRKLRSFGIIIGPPDQGE